MEDGERLASYLALLAVDKSERDREWKERFLNLLPLIDFHFSFGSEDIAFYREKPCIIVSRLKRGQIQALLEKQAWTSFKEISLIALQNKVGLIVNPDSEQRADWIFRCGDLENLVFDGVFPVDRLDFAYGDNAVLPVDDYGASIEKGTDLYFTSLDEHLSIFTIQNILDCICGFGFDNMSAAIQIHALNEKDYMSLVTTVTVEDFANTEDAQSFVEQLRWLVPSHFDVCLYQYPIADLFDAVREVGVLVGSRH